MSYIYQVSHRLPDSQGLGYLTLLRPCIETFSTRHAHFSRQGGKRADAIFCYIDCFRGWSRSTLAWRQTTGWPAKRTFRPQTWSTTPFIWQWKSSISHVLQQRCVGNVCDASCNVCCYEPLKILQRGTRQWVYPFSEGRGCLVRSFQGGTFQSSGLGMWGMGIA